MSQTETTHDVYALLDGIEDRIDEEKWDTTDRKHDYAAGKDFYYVSLIAQIPLDSNHNEIDIRIARKLDEILNNTASKSKLISFLAKDHSKDKETIRLYDNLLLENLDRTTRGQILHNLGLFYQERNQMNSAAIYYKKALDEKPSLHLTRGNYGIVLRELGMIEQSITQLQNSLLGHFSYANYANYLFTLPFIRSPPGTIYQEAKSFQLVVETLMRNQSLPLEKHKANDCLALKSRKLRIGFISSGFKFHSTGKLLFNLFSNYDKTVMEFICFHDSSQSDFLTQKLSNLVDEFIPVSGISDQKLAHLIISTKCDVFIDLVRYSNDGRMFLYATNKVAPVMASWMGGPQTTTGVSNFDAFICDQTLCPPGIEKWFTEKKLYTLPDDYISFHPVYEPSLSLSSKIPYDKNHYITFACFTKLARVNERILHMWANIIDTVPNSRFILQAQGLNEQGSVEHYNRLFTKYQIPLDRVRLVGYLPFDEWIEYLSTNVDIFLDTEPVSSSIEVLEALWMGVPVVAYCNSIYAGCHSVSHLYNANLSQFVANEESDYIALASSLAGNVTLLREYRQTLRQTMLQSPLSNGKKFAADFGEQLFAMYNDYCSNQ